MFEVEEGSLGTFRATTYDGRVTEVEATLDHGVWRFGGTWSRATVGELAPGTDGGALDVDIDEPLIRLGGVATSSAGSPDAIEEGWYHDPFIFDVEELLGGPVFMETTQNYTFGDFTIDQSLTLEASLQPVGSVVVPAGKSTSSPFAW